MSAVTDVFLGFVFLASGSLLSYFAGWVFSGALDDIERLVEFIKKSAHGE